jgi:octaprenyl-diphosphate synthase
MNYSDKQNIEAFQSLVRADLDSLEGSLQTALSSRVPLIREICQYIEDTPGKRLRPTCLFLAGRSSGNGHVDMIPAGLAVELIHTATLLHDDIVDRHSTRRGKPTVYAKWGNRIATIMGDFLYSKAFACLGEAGLFDVMEILARVTHVISEGEMLQFQYSRDINVSEDGYLEMIYKKTASLFSASCECGAALGGNGNGHRPRFSRFGENIGLAFQITDDLFDYLAIDKHIGKPTASDFSDGRVTLPFITSFRNAPDRAKRWISDLFGTGTDVDEHWDEVVSFVQEYGGVEYAMNMARDFGEKAKGSLLHVEPSRERDALCFAADYVVRRVDPFSK